MKNIKIVFSKEEWTGEEKKPETVPGGKKLASKEPRTREKIRGGIREKNQNKGSEGRVGSEGTLILFTNWGQSRDSECRKRLQKVKWKNEGGNHRNTLPGKKTQVNNKKEINRKKRAMDERASKKKETLRGRKRS